MKHIIILLSTLLLFFSCKPEEKDTLAYTIRMSEYNDKPSLEVTLSFIPSDSSATVLLFQDKGWGQENLHNLVHNLHIVEGAEQIVQKKENDHYVIEHSPDSERIVLSYTLVQDTEGELDTEKSIRPIINGDYFHIYSHNLFMLPKSVIDRTEDDFNVSIQWQEFPQNYTLQNSFGHGPVQSIGPVSESEFHSAVFIGGDFRVYENEIEGNSVVFATRGDWKVFEDSTIVSVLKNTIETQRDFWQDHSQEYFLVTMIPTVQKQGYSLHGTGLTNSFSTSVSNNEFVETDGLVYLFNHELQHNWTGKVIKNANEEEQYWFSEGFTEYYTFKNIAVNSIYKLDVNNFIKNMNGHAKSLFTSPVVAAPNSEINYDNFWSSYDYGKLPYFRGAVFAFYLDMKIREESDGQKSLDDLMLRIKEDALASDMKLDHSYFLAVIKEYLSSDISSFFKTHIIDGVPFDLAAIYSEFGLEFDPATEVFDLGFTLGEDGRSVVEVDERSNAYEAGLRRGDSLINYSYQRDYTIEAEFTVVRNNSKIDLSYYPVKNAEIPQLTFSEKNLRVLNL